MCCSATPITLTLHVVIKFDPRISYQAIHLTRQREREGVKIEKQEQTYPPSMAPTWYIALSARRAEEACTETH